MRVELSIHTGMAGTLIIRLGISVGVIIAASIIYNFALRTSHHYVSTLTCPKCSRTFDYKWVPLASFTALRLGTSRYLQCPFCRGWSTFNITVAKNK